LEVTEFWNQKKSALETDKWMLEVGESEVGILVPKGFNSDMLRIFLSESSFGLKNFHRLGTLDDRWRKRKGKFFKALLLCCLNSLVCFTVLPSSGRS
jgi:hypothetical protein